MTTKLGKVVIYHEELLLVKLLDPSIWLVCKVTCHAKYFISLLALDQLPNMARW